MATSNIYTPITVHGDIVATNNITASNNLTVDGVLTVDTVEASSLSVLSDLSAFNDIIASGTVFASVVNASINITGNNINAANDVTGNNITASNNVTASANVIGASLTVGGGDAMSFGKNNVAFNTSWSGPYASPQTVGFNASRFGSLCILRISANITAATTNSNINISGIDANYRPAVQTAFAIATYNQGTRAQGFLVINTDGTAILYQNLVGLTMFSSGASPGVGVEYTQSFSYIV